MDTLFENAHRIFDVARSAGAADNQDFALLIRPDGGLHFVMESPFSMEALALHCGARTAYRITRSCDGVRVDGRGAGKIACWKNPARPRHFQRRCCGINRSTGSLRRCSLPERLQEVHGVAEQGAADR